MEKLIKKTMKSTLILILTLILSCQTTAQDKDSINDIIISFYENKKEISNSNIKNLKSNFNELSNITNIITNAGFDNSNGIYLVRLNISHTTCNVLLSKDNNHKILSINGNIDQVLSDFTKIAKNMNLYEEIHYKSYKEIITRILNDNNEMVNSMTLKPLD